VVLEPGSSAEVLLRAADTTDDQSLLPAEPVECQVWLVSTAHQHMLIPVQGRGEIFYSTVYNQSINNNKKIPY
jgi:hypothetical protein